MIRTAFVLASMLAAVPALAAPTTKAAEFVTQAGASDQYEKTSSTLVLEATKRDDVRRFAQMMISDHGKTTQQVTAAAKADRVALKPPALTPEQDRMVRELRAANGAAREKLYLQQQVMAHQQALELHRTFAEGGDKPALRKVAATAVPIVQKHLEEVTAMQTAAAGR